MLNTVLVRPFSYVHRIIKTENVNQRLFADDVSKTAILKYE